MTISPSPRTNVIRGGQVVHDLERENRTSPDRKVPSRPDTVSDLAQPSSPGLRCRLFGQIVIASWAHTHDPHPVWRLRSCYASTQRPHVITDLNAGQASMTQDFADQAYSNVCDTVSKMTGHPAGRSSTPPIPVSRSTSAGTGRSKVCENPITADTFTIFKVPRSNGLMQNPGRSSPGRHDACVLSKNWRRLIHEALLNRRYGSR